MTTTPSASDVRDATRLEHLKWMILARAVDDRLAALYSSGGIRGGSVFLGRGQEAFSAAGAMPLRRGDVFTPLIRDQAGRLAFGETILDVMRTHLGRRTGPMRGRDGNIHRGSVDQGLLPMISHLGTSIAVLAGWLMARRLQGRAGDDGLNVALASIGDGGMQTGSFHEGLNVVAVEKLPLVLMVADNQFSYSTCSSGTYACRDLVDRAIGYGLRGDSCDGTDADACLAAMADAVARARRGEGPQMVVAKLLRLVGHGAHDDAAYVSSEVKSRFGDCLQLAERTLRKDGLIDEAGIAGLWSDARAQVQAALAQAQSEIEPDPDAEDWSATSVKQLARFKVGP